MKKTRILIIFCICLIPVFAIAGMEAMHEEDLDQIQGQTGITLSMGLTVEFEDMALQDSNGFTDGGAGTGAFTGAGWLILRNLDSPDFNITDLSIDVGSDGTNTVLRLDLGPTDSINGDLTIGDLVCGSNRASTQTVGEVGIKDMAIKTGRLRMSGHVDAY